MMPGEKARDFKGTMRKLIKALTPFRWSFLAAVIFASASTVFNIFGPKVLGKATTKLFEGAMAQITGTGSIDFAYIGNILISMAILYLLAAIFSYVQGWILSGVSAKVTYTFRKDIAEKVNRLPLGYFDRTSHGEVLSRVTNDVDTVSQTLNQSLSQFITSSVT
ncbi:MAG: ABC transporter transmembrane domain-containing protein, partial [Bellilinea sp.]